MNNAAGITASPVLTRHGIPLLAWPAEEALRRVLAANQNPRILMIAPGYPPPTVTDALEDWIRDPINAADLDARAAALARRAGLADPVELVDAAEPHVTVDEPVGAYADPSTRWVSSSSDLRPFTVPAPAEVAPTIAVDPEAAMLRVGRRWVALTALQLPVATYLVEHLGAVVPIDDLVTRYAKTDGSTHPAVLKSMLVRLAQRFASVGLDLHHLRDGNVLLERGRGA